MSELRVARQILDQLQDQFWRMSFEDACSSEMHCKGIPAGLFQYNSFVPLRLTRRSCSDLQELKSKTRSISFLSSTIVDYEGPAYIHSNSEQNSSQAINAQTFGPKTSGSTRKRQTKTECCIPVADGGPGADCRLSCVARCLLSAALCGRPASMPN